MRPEVSFQVRTFRVHLLTAGILALVDFLGGVRRQVEPRVVPDGGGRGDGQHRSVHYSRRDGAVLAVRGRRGGGDGRRYRGHGAGRCPAADGDGGVGAGVVGAGGTGTGGADRADAGPRRGGRGDGHLQQTGGGGGGRRRGGGGRGRGGSYATGRAAGRGSGRGFCSCGDRCGRRQQRRHHGRRHVRLVRRAGRWRREPGPTRRRRTAVGRHATRAVQAHLHLHARRPRRQPR